MLRAMLDPDLAEWIKHEAEYRRTSVAQIVRELIARAKEHAGPGSEPFNAQFGR